MSSELYLPRQEIRRLILAKLGMWTTAKASAQIAPQLNAQIDAAALQAAEDSREWLSLRRRASVPLDVGQEVIGYRTIADAYAWEQAWPNEYIPRTYGTEADPWQPPEILSIQVPRGDGIMEVVILVENGRGYRRMERKRQHLSDDPSWVDTHVQAEATESGNDPDAITAAQAIVDASLAEPSTFECRHDGVHVWPRPSRRCVFRIEHTINPSWGVPIGNETETDLDQRDSVVDAYLIIHAVCAEQRDHQGDTSSRDTHRSAYINRLGALRGFQHAGEQWHLDSDAAFDSTGSLALPNWDLGIRRPT